MYSCFAIGGGGEGEADGGGGEGEAEGGGGDGEVDGGVGEGDAEGGGGGGARCGSPAGEREQSRLREAARAMAQVLAESAIRGRMASFVSGERSVGVRA